MIDEYVTALDRRLRGPESVKADLLAEARDSLDDAAAAYSAGGLDAAEAQRRAVADFGPVALIARDYQDLLALAHGTRTLRALLHAPPLAHLMWELNRAFWISGDSDTPVPTWYTTIARLNDSTAWVVAGAALCALLTGRLLARRGTSSALLARLAGVFAVVAVGAVVCGYLAVLTATAHLDAAGLLLSPPVVAGSLVSLAVAFRLVVLARRCVVFASA